MELRNPRRRSTFSTVRRWTMSTSWVVRGAPCATAARPPTSRNSAPLAASSDRSVVSSEGGEAIAQVLDRLQHPVVLPQTLFGTEREQGIDQRHVDVNPLVTIIEPARRAHAASLPRIGWNA